MKDHAIRLIIISGRSGSGKSTAIHALEDLGYYCVDNLPLGLLPTLVDQLRSEEHHVNAIAVGIDARNLPSQLPRFDDILEQIRHQGFPTEVIFLDAKDEILLKRYSATRRKHPLGTDSLSLSEAIHEESRLLESIRHRADLIMDTSSLDPHLLRNTLRQRINQDNAGLSLLVESFSYLHGVPADADLVYDMRALPNPHWVPELRSFTGRDDAVIHYLQTQPDVQKMQADLTDFLRDWLPHYEKSDRSYMTIALGCTGGRHRSVFMADSLTRWLQNETRHQVQTRHRELGE